MKHSRLILLPLVSCIVLSGCAYEQRINSSKGETEAEVNAKRQPMMAAVKEAERTRVAAQEVGRPYIAGNQQPISREVAMPAALRKSVPLTAKYRADSADLTTVLAQLSDAAGMTFTATPDALLPPSSFAPRTGSTAQSPVQGPARITLQASNTPIWQVLDDVARQAQVSWRPVASGAEFYRVETKMFNLSGIPQVASVSASLGRNASNNAAFESQSKTAFVTKDQNVVGSMMGTINALLTVAGTATLNQESQTLVVTDTAQALNRVAAYVDNQNKQMSRRVRVVIEQITVTTKDNDDYGIDWNVIYAAASKGAAIVSPTSLAVTQAGNATFSKTSGPFTGSKLVLEALNEQGTVVGHRTFPFTTTSGRPVTQAIRNTFTYVDQVQATAISSSIISTTAQAPTVTQKEETVGTFVTVVPTAKPDGTIFLSVSLDVTSASPLTAFTVGSGASAVTVQQLNIDGTGVIQEVPVRSGQTVVIGGFEVKDEALTSRRLGANVPMLLGGSDQQRTTKSRNVLLVTAIAEEGI